MRIGVIGGGASGIMSALVAAKEGARVTILEHMPRIGKKILLTGSGKCNLTNEDMDLSHFHSDDEDLVATVLKECGKDKTLSFLSDIGLIYKCKNGYYYPYSEQASSLLDVFRFALRDLSVVIECEIDIKDININNSNDKSEFTVKTNKGNYYFDKIIIATGSKAYKNTGSDGSGYELAKSLGHSIVKVGSALTYLVCKEDFYSSIAGIRTNARVQLIDDTNKQLLMERSGQLQLTKTGISGIPVFDLSFLASKVIDSNIKISAIIDFLPEFSDEEVTNLLFNRAKEFPNRRFEELFAGVLNKNLGLCICKRANVKLSDTVNILSNKNGKEVMNRIVKNIKYFTTSIVKTGDFDNSQVCSGGVRLTEVNNHLESKIVKNIYFVGEVLNVNGDCGGYNLQWAFSSAMLAAKDCVK